MNLKLLRAYAFLVGNFRNGMDMVRTLRGGPACDRAVLRDGSEIVHPAGRAGLVEALLEVWHGHSYTDPEFYRPKAGDLIIDAGANIGLFTLAVARAEPGCRVVALEPFRETFDCLTANIRSAAPRPERVEAHNWALGAGAGRGRMASVSNRSLDNELRADSADDEGDDTVRIVGLAELLDLIDVPRVALLKVDIEGSEHDVFAAAEPSLLGRFDRIVVEYHESRRPGTLALLEERLAPTHRLARKPPEPAGCGLIYATRAPGPAAAVGN